MTLLAWNCRGLAQAESKRSLKAIVNKICPDLLFLSEVKISSNRVKSLLYSLGFYKLECVEPRGLKGGVILGWKNGVDVEIVMSNDNVINGLVFSDPINEPCHSYSSLSFFLGRTHALLTILTILIRYLPFFFRKVFALSKICSFDNSPDTQKSISTCWGQVIRKVGNQYLHLLLGD